MDFDKNLGAYPTENHRQWSGLSNYLTQTLINKLQPLNNVIISEYKENLLRAKEDQ